MFHDNPECLKLISMLIFSVSVLILTTTKERTRSGGEKKLKIVTQL